MSDHNLHANASATAMSDVNATAGSYRKQPRHFWEGPNPVATQGVEEKMHTSPVAQLYQHAFQSVFGFLELADLSHAMAVSHSWSAAVNAMPCAGRNVWCSIARLVPLCSSALSKHASGLVSSESKKSELSCEALDILTLAMPQLTVLKCNVLPSAVTKVILPSKLRTLELDLSQLDAAAINAVLNGVSQLKSVCQFELVLPSFLPAISFAPLAAVASLQDLELSSGSAGSQPTAPHLDQLRALPQLRKMAVWNLSSQSMQQLLRDPHALRWQQIHTVRRTDAVASAALSSLSSLTGLKAFHCTDISFLAHLVQLRTLDLHMEQTPWPATITADAVIEGLSCCSQLSDLALTAPLNSKHLSVLLPCLPLLAKLCLWRMNELDSLACLSSGPIVARLQSLRLFNCNHAALRSRELQHVYALTALENLTIEEMFAGERFNSLDLWLHTPPSKLMPKLKSFTYLPPQ